MTADLAKDQLRAHAALFAVALIYGANYTIAKVVLDDDYLHPMAFISLRVGAGIVAFWLLHALWVKERVQRSDFPRLVLCGIFGVALNQSLFFIGLDYTTPINASLIMTTTPVLVLVASAIMLKETIQSKKVAGILIGMAGAVVLIIYGKKFAFNKDGWFGDLLVFINATSYGLYLVLVKPLLVRYHPLTVVKWVFLIGSLGVLPFGLPELMQTPWQTFTPHVWLAIAYVLV
ncbi:MAG: DMT family transporter, partial [Bacteroidetes bacterium]